VERILNDGTLDDCRELIQVLGGKRVAEVFFSATGRQKQNYYRRGNQAATHRDCRTGNRWVVNI